MAYAHIKNGVVHWIAPVGQVPDQFEPGFLGQVPDDARVGDRWDGTTLTPAPVPPSPTLDELKEEASNIVDQAAGVARARYITVAPGQEAVYVLKEREARDYKAAGYPASPVPPLVQADADALGLTPQAAADAIIAQADAWIGIAAQIERERRSGKAAVSAAADAAAVQAAASAAVTALGSI